MLFAVVHVRSRCALSIRMANFAASVSITKRAEFPSSRLFGNLTRGGPTSVQNPVRGEG